MCKESACKTCCYFVCPSISLSHLLLLLTLPPSISLSHLLLRIISAGGKGEVADAAEGQLAGGEVEHTWRRGEEEGGEGRGGGREGSGRTGEGGEVWEGGEAKEEEEKKSRRRKKVRGLTRDERAKRAGRREEER